MANNDCKMARGMNIIFGLLSGFTALGLFVVGVTLLPVIGLFLAVAFLIVSILFLLAPRDEACYMDK
jgi:hypothetical protein